MRAQTRKYSTILPKDRLDQTHLRPAQLLAARHQRERQQAPPPVLPQGDGLLGGGGRGGRQGAGPAQRQAAQDAGLEDAGGGAGAQVNGKWCNDSVNLPGIGI